jgi:1-acyl-sn-glycerol-3-phosphate acyltransferase
MVRTLVVYAWVVFSTVICGITATLCSFFSRTGNLPHLVARFWGNSILMANLTKVSLSGLHHIDPSQPLIYMANHQSNFDIPVLLGKLPVQFRWLAKAELFKIPIFGRGMRGCGYISIDRSDHKAAVLSLKEAARTIRAGASVLIFPEGTRSPDGRIQPMKKGGFILAIEAGVPIVPIIIHGTRNIMAKGESRINPGNVRLDIKPPIITSAYTRKDKDRLLAKIQTIIEKGFENTDGATA